MPKFNKEWVKKYPELAVFKRVPDNQYSAYCAVCKCNIGVHNMGGIHALIQHLKTKKHLRRSSNNRPQGYSGSKTKPATMSSVDLAQGTASASDAGSLTHSGSTNLSRNVLPQGYSGSRTKPDVQSPVDLERGFTPSGSKNSISDVIPVRNSGSLPQEYYESKTKPDAELPVDSERDLNCERKVNSVQTEKKQPLLFRYDVSKSNGVYKLIRISGNSRLEFSGRTLEKHSEKDMDLSESKSASDNLPFESSETKRKLDELSAKDIVAVQKHQVGTEISGRKEKLEENNSVSSRTSLNTCKSTSQAKPHVMIIQKPDIPGTKATQDMQFTLDPLPAGKEQENTEGEMKQADNGTSTSPDIDFNTAKTISRVLPYESLESKKTPVAQSSMDIESGKEQGNAEGEIKKTEDGISTSSETDFNTAKSMSRVLPYESLRSKEIPVAQSSMDIETGKKHMKKMAKAHLMRGGDAKDESTGSIRRNLWFHIRRGSYLLFHAIGQLMEFGDELEISTTSDLGIQEIFQRVKDLQSQEDSGNAAPPTGVSCLEELKGCKQKLLKIYIENIWELMLSATCELRELDASQNSKVNQGEKLSSTHAGGMDGIPYDSDSNCRILSVESVPNYFSNESRGVKRLSNEECSEEPGTACLVRKKLKKSQVWAQGHDDAPSTSSHRNLVSSHSTSNISPFEPSGSGKECDDGSLPTREMGYCNMDAVNRQEKSIQVGDDLSLSLQGISVLGGQIGSDNLLKIEVAETSVQVPEEDFIYPSVEADPTAVVHVRNNNLFNKALREDYEETLQVSEGEDQSPSVKADSAENFAASASSTAVANFLAYDGSFGSDSSGAFVISKDSKSEEKADLVLKKEKNVIHPDEEEDISSPQIEIAVQDSEILWSLFCIIHKLSYNTFNTAQFHKMFPDSNLAHLTDYLNTERLPYIVSYGLELYFRMELLCTLKKNEYCVLIFKEHLQDTYKQIDLYIRFWNLDTSQVEIKYLNSRFIKLDGIEESITEWVLECLKDLDDCRIIQFCLDGSQISLQYLSYLQTAIVNRYSYNLVNVNNTLYSIYEAFESGALASEWNLGDILRTLHLIFKDSPQRKQEYIKITHSYVFPLPFQSQWLLANIQAAERAFEIWSCVKKYLSFICLEYPSLLKLNHFATMKKACDDVLMPVKLKFFISIGKRMEYLLNLFKSEKPMLPFFHKELKSFVNKCTSYYKVKKISDSDVQTVDKLVDFELNNNPSTIRSNVQLGFSGERILREISHHKVTGIEQIVMRCSAQEFVLKLIEELSNDPKLNYSLFEYLSCLDPVYMVSNTEDCSEKFEHILLIFVKSNHLHENMCEELQQQFTVFLEEAVLHYKDDFQKFDPADDDSRLDTFLQNYLSDAKFGKLWLFIRGLLLLFNGHVDSAQWDPLNVDEDFEDLQTDFIARRFVSDQLNGLDTNIVITDEMREVVNEAVRNHMDLDRYVAESPT